MVDTTNFTAELATTEYTEMVEEEEAMINTMEEKATTISLTDTVTKSTIFM